MLPRDQAYMQARRKRINDLLRLGCEKEHFTFIENKDIVIERHIRSDGVHLNKAGTFKLSKNFLAALNGDTVAENNFRGELVRRDDLDARELNGEINGESNAIGNDFMICDDLSVLELNSSIN